VELLAERILFLKGDVNMVPAGSVERITEPKAILACARSMEEQSGFDYNQAALECARNADSATKQIFERLVTDEERHYDLFDKQADNVDRFGVSYLALQSFQGGAGGPGEPGPTEA